MTSEGDGRVVVRRHRSSFVVVRRMYVVDVPIKKRWELMYRVWVGMLCYSASMCRGYLHAKSLGEGGEFLSYVWLVISLKGAKTLADKLQTSEEELKAKLGGEISKLTAGWSASDQQEHSEKDISAFFKKSSN
jgi:hypothetical protein